MQLEVIWEMSVLKGCVCCVCACAGVVTKVCGGYVASKVSDVGGCWGNIMRKNVLPTHRGSRDRKHFFSFLLNKHYNQNVMHITGHPLRDHKGEKNSRPLR